MRQYKFYFSAKQKELETIYIGDPFKTTFKGQEYTECHTVESEFYSAGLLKPHNERFSDSVYLGMGTENDIKVVD